MLNVIWLCMIVVAVLVGGFTGRLEVMTAGAFATAEQAVMKIALPLVGLWAIWMGMMRLAEQAGLVRLLARALRPVMRFLFPDVPADHPATGAMVLNMSANMLGLGNAATPLGLRAMALLQKLNHGRASASNSMVTFLAVNTASIQLVPTTAISILAINGAGAKASEIVVPALIATTVAMACGVTVARALARFFPQDEVPTTQTAESGKGDEEIELPSAQPLSVMGRICIGGFVGAFVLMLVAMIAPGLANGLPEAMGWEWRYANFQPEMAGWKRVMLAASVLAVPFLLGFFPLFAHLRGVRVYEQFCEGAKDAFTTAQRVIPYLVAMLVGIRLLRDSGVLGYVTDALRPALNYVHFPTELLPLALMRPLSGGASNGIFVELVQTHGADSMIARMAATIYGSTETTFYVLAVYFGSVGIRRSRHAVIAGLTADVVAMVVAVAMCWLMFG